MKVLILKFYDFIKMIDLLYSNNLDDIKKENIRMTTLLFIMMVGVFLLLYLFSFFVPAISYVRTLYILAFLGTCLLWCVYRLMRKNLKPVFFLYVFFSVLVFYSILVSSSYALGQPSVTILLLLVLMPAAIMDRPWRVVLFEIVVCTAYIMMISLFKTPTVVLEELVNTVVFAVVGSILGSYSKMMKVVNFDLKRKALLEKSTDYLTGLFNRMKMFEDISLPKLKKFTGVMMLDIDKFKLYNDVYGHQAGDEVLIKVGKCFSDFAKKRDVSFYRYGGEEFVVLTHGNSKKKQQALGEALNKAVSSMSIVHKKSNSGIVTISVGFSFVSSFSESINYELLINQADLALYYAKKDGRNQTIGYQDFMLEDKAFHEMKNHTSKLLDSKEQDS